MFKNLLLIVFVLFTAHFAKAEDQKIASKVEKVIVFLNGAQVTRTAVVNINAGTSTLIFENISPDLDAQTMQVHASGEFTILSVKHELDFLGQQTKQKRLEELKAEQKVIKDKIDIQNGLTAVYQEEENMLIKNQLITGQTTGLDIVKLKQALDFQTERLTAIKKKQQNNNAQILALTTELVKYNQQIADMTKGASMATSNILVTVSAKTPVRTEFKLSYATHNASWFPSYDIRAKDVNSPINITYKANVTQQSGEEWKNVKLTLSTGNPTVSGSKPELSPYYLDYGTNYSNRSEKITQVKGRVIASEDGHGLSNVAIKVRGSSIGTITDANGNYSLQIPSGKPVLVFSFIGYETVEKIASSASINVVLTASINQLNEVQVANGDAPIPSQLQAGTASPRQYKNKAAENIPPEVASVENQTNVEFDIANPYSVPSDGKQYTVEINQIDLGANYQYAVTPKLSPDVFLTAKLTDWNKYNFISGEANLFFEGTFIGKSLINTEVAVDTLNLSLGSDKNIIVTRTSAKNLTDRQVFGSNKKEIRDWQIEIKNRKNQLVNLLVEDQVPVSQNSSIEVENQELSGGQLDKVTGKISWVLPIKAQESKKVELRYQVKYPKNQSIIIQ